MTWANPWICMLPPATPCPKQCHAMQYLGINVSCRSKRYSANQTAMMRKQSTRWCTNTWWPLIASHPVWFCYMSLGRGLPWMWGPKPQLFSGRTVSKLASAAHLNRKLCSLASSDVAKPSSWSSLLRARQPRGWSVSKPATCQELNPPTPRYLK